MLARPMEGLLADLREAQVKLRRRADLDPEMIGHAEALARLQARLAEKPRVIVLGEANAGKTSLVNLLLDQMLLPESVLANTRRPVVLRFAPSVVVTGLTPFGRLDLGRRDMDPGDMDPGDNGLGDMRLGDMGLGDIKPQQASILHSLEVGLPNPRLTSFDLVDTPALSTSVQLDWLQPGADLLLWCTVATQAWKESERRLWMTIGKRHRQHAILVATHMDNLRGDDSSKIRARLTAEAADCFSAIALVCASRPGGSPLGREDSGTAELDALIASRLSTMAERRRRTGYRLANCIVARALKRMEAVQNTPTPQVDSLTSRR
jgi:hypothetical protein